MSENALTRLLAWLQSIIRRKPKQSSLPPLFTTLKEQRWSNGLLRRVKIAEQQRPDAVETFLFVPYPKQGQPLKPDCLICCDMLDGREKRLISTHQVSVLLIPHFAKDLSRVQILYSAPWDFQRGQYRNFYVFCIMQRVANELQRQTPESVNWHVAIGVARSECWDGISLPPPPMPAATDIYVEPYDPGTRRLRVRMRWAMLWVAWLFADG